MKAVGKDKIFQQSVDQTDAENFVSEEISKTQIEKIEKEYQQKFEKMQNDSEGTVKELINEITIKNIQLHFERIYNVIFGSQIALLEDLLIKPVGETKAYLENFFNNVKIYHPVLKDWTLDRYLNLLLNNQLIELTQMVDIK